MGGTCTAHRRLGNCIQNISQKIFRYLWEGNIWTGLQDVTM